MNSDPPSSSLSRRDALRQTLLASLGLTSMAVAVPPSIETLEPIFIPENDYPFFGFDPDQPQTP